MLMLKLDRLTIRRVDMTNPRIIQNPEGPLIQSEGLKILPIHTSYSFQSYVRRTSMLKMI